MHAYVYAGYVLYVQINTQLPTQYIGILKNVPETRAATLIGLICYGKLWLIFSTFPTRSWQEIRAFTFYITEA